MMTMKRLFNFSYRFVNIRYASTNTQRMGLPFKIDENQALTYFNRWRKSLWLAPSDWQQTPVTLTARYLPCWSFSLEGNISAEAYIKRGSWLFGGTEWHPFSDKLSLKNTKLSDINIYAAHTYDRRHIDELEIKLDDDLKSIVDASDLIEEWTIDRDTAFEIGWNLIIINRIQELFLKQLNREKKNEYRFTSIRFPITTETQELIYFPVYIVDYQYRNRQWQCLINGRTGKVTGLRQFSRFKITGVILGIIYPACIMSSVSVLSFLYYAVTHRIFTIPIALLTTGLTLPFVTIAAVQLGRYVRDYSHLYRGKRDIQEWINFKRQNPNIFNEKYFEQKDEPPIFERQRTQETRKPTYGFEIGPDLYGILGISRVASNAVIKQAYLSKVKEFHPDRNMGSKEIEEKFKLINQAYAILSDPEQRQIFDEYGYEHVKYK